MQDRNDGHVLYLNRNHRGENLNYYCMASMRRQFEREDPNQANAPVPVRFFDYPECDDRTRGEVASAVSSLVRKLNDRMDMNEDDINALLDATDARIKQQFNDRKVKSRPRRRQDKIMKRPNSGRLKRMARTR
jgi:hypothetical protein